MRLPQNTEDSLACCLDAVADPIGWGPALQRLGESLGAESCTFCSADLQQLSALVMPISTGHGDFAERWLRNECHAPDPHFDLWRYRPHKASAVILEHQISTDEERRTPSVLSRNRAAGATAVVGDLKICSRRKLVVVVGISRRQVGPIHTG